MPNTINDLLEMSQKTKELSEHIASLKRKSRMMPDGPDKGRNGEGNQAETKLSNVLYKKDGECMEIKLMF